MARSVLAIVAIPIGAFLFAPQLPAQEIRETFDEIAAGSLPTGFVAKSGSFRVDDAALLASPDDGDAELVLPWEPLEEFSFSLSIARPDASSKGAARVELRFAGLANDGGDVGHHAIIAQLPERKRPVIEHAVTRRDGSRSVRVSEPAPEGELPGAITLRVDRGAGRVRVSWNGERVFDSWFTRDAAPSPVAIVVSGAPVSLDDLVWR
ncbi:MAG TPA: hypothetical protein VK116_19060, partial [Planctomycetota bacterium]|nr:hypothetical protein [Planctomycetota bacterium]